MAKEATHKQNSVLWQFTGEKFWLCEPPHPSIEEASAMIDLMFKWATESKWGKITNTETEALAFSIEVLVQKFFPDWTREDLKFRRTGKKKKNGFTPKKKEDAKPTELLKDISVLKDIQEKEKEETPEPKEETEQPKPATKEIVVKDLTEDITARIEAGIKNIFLSGPAGCGKTVTCNLVAEKLNLPIVVVSCNAGTSPAEITGFKYPEPRHSAVTQALPIEGIIVFDEITTLDPAVCASANALLANNKILSSMGEILRHENCIIIATSNLLGDGRDRQYISNNQLDAATMDRFVGGIIIVDYSHEYESQYTAVCKTYIEHLRDVVKNNKLRRIVSTRALQAACLLKEKGLDWKSIIVAAWTKEERNLI